VLLLNGTPIANHPGDMYTQGYIMDPKILECENYYQFRARYGVMGGYMMKEVVKWVNLEDLQRRFSPFVLRRLKVDCLDLPPKLEPVTFTAVLTPRTWEIYKEMREELIAWLTESTVSTAAQAVVKALRLSQVTSGFIGGVQPATLDDDTPEAETKEISREKLDLFLDWLDRQIEEDPNFKLLVWSRWRAEVERLYNGLNTWTIPLHIGRIWGGQTQAERSYALQLLDPRSTPNGPVVVIGTPASGSMGLNLAGAHTVMYLSNDYSLKTRLQSEDRVHRPGQIYPVSYFDMVAVGPQGQKTIDHIILKALRKKEDLANYTTSAWIEGLREE
jgi:SNF2 family DNA or RNA helicase